MLTKSLPFGVALAFVFGGLALAADENMLTSKDGVLTLRMPAEWKQVQPKNPAIVIKGDPGPTDYRQICVYSVPKIDYDTLMDWVKIEHAGGMAPLKNAQSSEPIKTEVNGHPAIRFDITFSEGGVHYGRVEVYTETATRFNQVITDGALSQFNQLKDEWAGYAKNLTENPKK